MYHLAGVATIQCCISEFCLLPFIFKRFIIRPDPIHFTFWFHYKAVQETCIKTIYILIIVEMKVQYPGQFYLSENSFLLKLVIVVN